MITRSCELCVKMENITILFFWLQVAVSTCMGLSDCMVDCTSLLTPHPPSLYEQHCCIPSNSGKKFNLKENKITTFILCPIQLPASCQRFPLNCSKLFTEYTSVPSGYYIMRSSNGSLISIYCKVEDYIDGYNCSQVFQENNSAQSGYYKILADGVMISKYCDIVEYINSFSFSNCSQVFKTFSSAPSAYYTIQLSNYSLILIHCNLKDYINSLYLLNCSQILQTSSAAPSGFYKIQAPNGSLISVYCDMEGSNCDGKGGWMRVGYLNMSEPGATCPPGLTLRQFSSIDHGVCGLSIGTRYATTFFPSHAIQYNMICGQIRGYQFRAPDAFPPLGGQKGGPIIDNCNTYVDGVTITYGSNPRKHIWTYACGLSEGHSWGDLLCPCNTRSFGTTSPNFVGNDNYCESGLPEGQWWQDVLYSSDPLWDGQQCNGNERPCCTNPKMPWFIKTLNETTTEDIELRVCASQGYSDEDTPLDIIELYVR